jgi:hypothetical protein
MYINRRTAISGLGAALAASGLSVAATTLSPLSGHASEPLPLAGVPTRLGAAMDEVSSLLEQWDPHFRAIIGVNRDYWLQNARLSVPRTTEQLIDAWFVEHDNLQNITRRLKAARSQKSIDHLSNLRMFHAVPAENEARNAVLRALLNDRRAAA